MIGRFIWGGGTQLCSFLLVERTQAAKIALLLLVRFCACTSFVTFVPLGFDVWPRSSTSHNLPPSFVPDKGHIEQEQPKAPQPPSQSQVGASGAGDVRAASSNSDKVSSSSSSKGERTAEVEAETKARGNEEEEGEQCKGEGEGEVEGEKEVRDEDVKELYDDEAQLCGMPEAADPKLFADGLALRRYQRQALAWMIQREKKRYVSEEDCTGLSLISSSQHAATRPEEASSAAASPAPESGVAVGSDGGDGVVVRDGCVHVSAWESAAGGDCGGGSGVSIHPLWERRAAASLARGSAITSFSSSILALGGGRENGREAAGGVGETGGRCLSHPEVFYVNVYSRRFQREFPPASLGCRGGILADEMGMGKVSERSGWGRGRGGCGGDLPPL